MVLWQNCSCCLSGLLCFLKVFVMLAVSVVQEMLIIVLVRRGWVCNTSLVLMSLPLISSLLVLHYAFDFAGEFFAATGRDMSAQSHIFKLGI